MRTSARPLAPSSRSQYQKVLLRAFGSADFPLSSKPIAQLSKWRPSQLELLRAAVIRTCRENKHPPDAWLDAVPPAGWEIKKAIRTPSEAETELYERSAGFLHAGQHALALLPLSLGLRAAEVLSLERSSVTRAGRFGRLLITRKGSKEQELPAQHAAELFDELLSVPGANGKRWERAGDILNASRSEQYHSLRKLIRRTAERAEISMRPHLLRHAFATRMQRAGASLAQIQYMLGHASPTTTARYVHVAAADVEKFMSPVASRVKPRG